jgi:hypothetical protein
VDRRVGPVAAARPVVERLPRATPIIRRVGLARPDLAQRRWQPGCNQHRLHAVAECLSLHLFRERGGGAFLLSQGAAPLGRRISCPVGRQHQPEPLARERVRPRARSHSAAAIRWCPSCASFAWPCPSSRPTRMAWPIAPAFRTISTRTWKVSRSTSTTPPSPTSSTPWRRKSAPWRRARSGRITTTMTAAWTGAPTRRRTAPTSSSARPGTWWAITWWSAIP